MSSPEGFGLFEVDDADGTPEGMFLLGQDLTGGMAASERADFEAMLGLSAGDLDAATLGDAVWRVLTELADPTGGSLAPPLMPLSGGLIRLRVGGSVRERRYDPAEHPHVLTVARADYAALTQRDDWRNRRLEERGFTRAEVKTAGLQAALATMARKLGVRPSDIAAPSGGAIYGDTFVETGGNVAIASHTPTGSNAGSGWSAVNGTWQVNATDDTAEQTTVTDPGSSREEDDLSTDDMRVYLDVFSIGDFRAGGPLGRYASAAETYYAYSRDVSNTASHELFSRVTGGTPTQLAAINNDYPDPATPYELRLIIDGSDLEGLEASVSKVTVTDTGITGNTRGGVYSDDAVSNTGIQIANFTMEDISAGPAEVSLAGDMPAASGALGVKYITPLAGDMPAPSGSAVSKRFADLAGDMPAPSGALSSQSVVAVGLAGEMPAASGALAELRLVELAGDFPAPTGALAAKYLIALSGDMPAPSGSAVSKRFADLVGDMPAPSGALSSQSVVAIDLAGEMPAASGVVDGLYEIALAGSMPAAAGAVAVLYAIALAGDLPAMVGSLTSKQFASLAGDLPAMSGALAAVELGEFNTTPISGRGSNVTAVSGGGSIGVISGTGRA
jgi:hypothetical protein